MRAYFTALFCLALAACNGSTARREPLAQPSHGVIGVQAAQLDAAFWIRRQAQSSRLVLDGAAIAAQNARLFAQDKSVHDLQALPPQIDRARIEQWLDAVSSRPQKPLYDERGAEVGAGDLDALVAATNRAALAAQTPLRYGMVVRRADLRAFPTRQRVFSTPQEHDIDRFQESALFPGTPVAILQESRDGQWWFVVSALYAAWIEKAHVAAGDAAEIFAYVHKTPYLVVTGSSVQTVYTPEQPGVSALQLDMGVRVPLLADWPADRPVNGQHPYTSQVIELPLRDQAGRLQFVPALLPRSADTANRYLPLNSANLLRQSFKFLGERYGWGHSYNARDCSGFVSEVYRSFGVTLPRNTRDMGTSPALNRIALGEGDDHAARLAILRQLQPGDLVFIPGHVMMIIGHIGDEPYVIHDTTGFSYRAADGQLARVALNAVSVSPLTPLLGGSASYVDRIYSIQRIRN